MNKKAEMKNLNLEYAALPDKIKTEWSLSRIFVAGEGPLDAKVMFVGQAPGRFEDIERRPFIGTSGKFLTKLMNIAGLDRETVYICSVVQFFPPKNRVPSPYEVELCRDFLSRQIEIVDPKIIVLLGSLACKTILDLDGVAKIHGKTVRKDRRLYLVSMHPAAAVRIRTKMPIMEKDFERFSSIIKKELKTQKN